MSIDSKIIKVLNQINEKVASNESYNNRGAWAPTTSYTVNDVVTVHYAYWVCTSSHTSETSIDHIHWEHLGVYTQAQELDPSLVGVISTKP